MIRKFLKLFSIYLFFVSNTGNTTDINLNRVYRCDSLFCPSGSSTISAEAAALKERVGIVIAPSIPTNFPQVPRRVIRASASPTRQAQSPTANPKDTVRPTRESMAALESGSTSTASTGAGNGEYSGTQPGEPPASRDTGMAYGAPLGSNQPGTTTGYSGSPSVGGNSGTQLKAGGFLYSNDSGGSKNNNNKSTFKPAQGPSALSQMAGQSAIDMNKKNSKKDDAESASAFNPNSAGSGGGNFGPSGPVAAAPKKGLVGQVKDGLSKLADSLGNKFFGTSGRKGFRRGKKRFGKKGKNKKLNMKNAKGFDPNLLKRGLAGLNRKGTLNQLEFGSARSFLFNNMCNHYVRYARANRIPNDRSPCPRQ